jgi:hypothetical protein
MFVDVLLRGALVAQHLPPDEVLVRHHDAKARVGLRDAQHLLDAASHVEEVLEGAEAADVVEGGIPEGELLPCPDGEAGAGRDLLRDAHRLIRQIDADRIEPPIARRFEQEPRSGADVEQS